MICRQFLVFVGGGIFSAIVDVAAMQILLLLDIHYSVAVFGGFALGLTVNYICHARVTFGGSSSVATMARFGLVVLMNYLITMGCVIFSQHMLASVLIGKIASLPMVAVNGYLWSRYWVFR